MFWTGVQIDSAPFHGVAYDFIRRQIHLGAMRPSERFPAERSLAETLGISRATLREALKRLEGDGYLVSLRGAGGGNFVTDEAAINALAGAHMRANTAQVWRSLEYLQAILEHAAILACQRRSPADLAVLREAAATLAGAETGGDLREAQHLWLSTLARATLNDLFLRGVDEALAGIFHPVTEAAVASRRAELSGLWSQLTEALSARDAQAAAPACKAVFAELSDHVLSAMGEPVRSVAPRPPLGSETA